MSEPRFVTSVFDISTLPTDRPFVAFAGRSNVGKSSAVNRLVGRKNLARTSSKPGKTASINIYDGDMGNFYIADLPGYGYARVSKETKKSWGTLMESFFSVTSDIKLVVCFIDVRHEPEKSDCELVDFLALTGLPFCPVFTKADKISQTEAEKNVEKFTALLRKRLKGTKANMLSPVLFSAEKGTGSDNLRSLIIQMSVL